MSDVKVAKLEAADIAVFRAIRLESLRLAPSAFGSTEADWSSLSDEEWFSRIKNPVFALMRGEEPVGVMGLLIQRGAKKRHRATLIMVYLSKGERGNGLADHLLQSVIAFAKDAGVRQLELNVSHDNLGAIRFYERYGFKQVGKIPAALIEEGREVDELLMVSQLT